MKTSHLLRICLACLLPFLLLAVAPLTFYFGNINEISFTLKEVIVPVSGLFLGASALFYLMLSAVREKPVLGGLFAGLLAGLALAVWIQSQLMAWDFGLLNGQKIDWDRWKSNLYLEGVVWLLTLAGGMTLFLRKKTNTPWAVIAGIYLAGLLSVAAAWIHAPGKAEVPVGEKDYREIFAFHPENNVLVILLDTYQSDYFEKIAREYPGEVKFLNGFTFYRNTASRFPTTKGSLPSILTGEIYRNDRTFQEFFNESHRKFNLVEAYQKRSYRAHMVGLTGSAPGVVPMNSVVGVLGKDYVPPVYEYLDYALFRALPTVCKPRIYNTGQWFLALSQRRNYPPGHIGTDVRFMELVEREARVTREKGLRGSFKFFHFSIPHAPSMLDENLQFNTRLSGTEGYERQARGAIRLAGNLLAVMKKLGIYDRSEIVILSDHGTMNIPQADRLPEASDILSPVSESVRTSSHALLLHKSAGSTGPIVTSEAPLKLSDLSCLLGVRPWDTTGTAQRTFYYYDWDDDWNSEYMPDMTEYLITGHVMEKSGYRRTPNVYTAQGTVEKPVDKIYRIGMPILFSAGGGSADYTRGGWSVQEPEFRWSEGPRSGISLQLEQNPAKDLVLRLWGSGYMEPGTKEYQQVDVIVNGTKVAHWDMWGTGMYEAPIPARLVSDGKIGIIFECRSPRRIPADLRHIALLVNKLVVEEK